MSAAKSPSTQATQARKSDEPRFVINIQLANDGEPRKVFVGADGNNFLIERGKDVTVPQSVLGVLDNAVLGVPEQDPEDENKIVMVDRKRFPYTVVRAL